VTRIIDVADLAHSETSYEFEGYHHGGTRVSFIVECTPPGSPIREQLRRVFTTLAGHVLLRFRRVGTQPQRDVGGLHGLLNHY
jgi:hypothetical protein